MIININHYTILKDLHIGVSHDLATEISELTKLGNNVWVFTEEDGINYIDYTIYSVGAGQLVSGTRKDFEQFKNNGYEFQR